MTASAYLATSAAVRSHVHRFRVIYGDTDMMGVVYYANYLRYFEAGRSELLRAFAVAYKELESAGYALPVAEAHTKYHASSTYDDLLTLTTTVERVRFSSVKMSYRLEREDDARLIATGFTVHACINKEGRVCRLPDSLREALIEG